MSQTSEIIQELLTLKTKISQIPQVHQTSAVTFEFLGRGGKYAQSVIPKISTAIDASVKYLETGLDFHNQPITKPQIADNLKQLIDAFRQPASINLLSIVIDSEGIKKLKNYMNELEQIANRIK